MTYNINIYMKNLSLLLLMGIRKVVLFEIENMGLIGDFVALKTLPSMARASNPLLYRQLFDANSVEKTD